MTEIETRNEISKETIGIAHIDGGQIAILCRDDVPYILRFFGCTVNGNIFLLLFLCNMRFPTFPTSHITWANIGEGAYPIYAVRDKLRRLIKIEISIEG